MNDREWLERVSIAADYYVNAFEASKDAVGEFVKWMYALYGIVLPVTKKEDNET